jgi:cytochrome c biogenesis protein CcmG, thiol:disulfide interchange protein DsbE
MAGRRMKTLAGGLVALAAVLALAVFGLASTSQPAGGRRAPALPSESLSGGRATLASLEAGAHGRASVIVFWASWCSSCKQEAPAFERFYRSPEGHGRVVGVDWSDPETWAARRFVRRYGWTFPNLRDAHGLVGNDYGLGAGLPDTFVVNARGRISKVLRGPQSVQSLRTALAQVERS